MMSNFTRAKPPEACSSPSPYGLRAPFNRSMGHRISPYIRFEDITKFLRGRQAVCGSYSTASLCKVKKCKVIKFYHLYASFNTFPEKGGEIYQTKFEWFKTLFIKKTTYTLRERLQDLVVRRTTLTTKYCGVAKLPEYAYMRSSLGTGWVPQGPSHDGL